MKYLAIKDEDDVKAQELLISNNITIQGIWDKPFNIFAESEAESRITWYEDEEKIKIPDNKKDLIRIELYSRYSNSEDILDGDYLSSIQYDTIKKYL